MDTLYGAALRKVQIPASCTSHGSVWAPFSTMLCRRSELSGPSSADRSNSPLIRALSVGPPPKIPAV